MDTVSNSYPDGDPIDIMASKYRDFNIDKLMQAAEAFGYDHPMDYWEELDKQYTADNPGQFESDEMNEPLEEGMLNDLFQTVYRATGKMLDKMPVIGDKREQKRIAAHRNNFVNTMTDEKIDQWREELHSKLKSEHSATQRMFSQRFEILAKEIERAKSAQDPKSYTRYIDNLTRSTRSLEKAIRQSNAGVAKRIQKAKLNKRMAETRNPLKKMARMGHEASPDVYYDERAGVFEIWHHEKGSAFPAIDKDPDGKTYADKTSNPNKLVRYARSAFKPGQRLQMYTYGDTSDPTYNAGVEALMAAGFDVHADTTGGTSTKQGELDLDNPKQPTKGQQDMFGENEVMEGFGSMSGSSKTSYQGLDNVKIVVKHKAPVNEESRGSRSRNIHSIYIQRGEERFKMQENNLKAARAMARHINQGGEVFDSVGSSIMEMAAEQRKLKEFVRYVKNANLINETNEEYVQLAKENINHIKTTLEKLCGAKTYANAVESIDDYNNVEILEDDLDLESKFTETHFDNKVAGVTDSIRRSVSKRNAYRESIQNAISEETFDGLSSMLQETDGVVEFATPHARLSHQVSMLGDAAQNEALRNQLYSISKTLEGGGSLGEFEYSTVKSCLMSAGEQAPASNDSGIANVAEGYANFLEEFDIL